MSKVYGVEKDLIEGIKYQELAFVRDPSGNLIFSQPLIWGITIGIMKSMRKGFGIC